MKLARCFPAVFSAALLASCGGGGGGGSAVVSPPPPAPDLAITADNAFDVASAVVQSAGLLFELGTVSDGGLGGSASAQATGWRAYAARSSLMRAQGLAQSGTVTASLAFELPPEGCLVSGWVTFSGNIADETGNSLTEGDRIRAVFEQCDDNEGVVLDGQLELVVRQIEDDPISSDFFLLRLDTTLTGFQVTVDGETESANGSFTLTLDSRHFPLTVTRIVGAALKVLGAGEEATLSGFDHWLEEDFGGSPVTHRARASGTLTSKRIGGTVRYATPAGDDLLGLNDDDPSSGVIEITGKTSSRIRVVVVDTGIVVLEVDTDGDSVVDHYIDTTWAALEGGQSTVSSAAALDIAREAYTAIGQLGSAAVSLGQRFQSGAAFDQLAALGPGTVAPTMVLCPDIGFAMVSGELAAGGTFAPGDTLRAEFDTCTGGPESLSGLADLTIDSWQSNGGFGFSYAVSFTATVTGLDRVVTGSPAVTANGTFTHSFDGLSQPGALQLSVSAGTFVVADATATRQLSGALNSATFSNPAPGTFLFEVSASGGLTSSILAGSFAYQTLASLQSVSDNDPATGPASGQLRVKASDDSSVTLVALDNLNVRLDIDLDGNGSTDESQFATWAEIQ